MPEVGAQTSPYGKKAKEIADLTKLRHFSPPAIDDRFSEIVLETTLLAIDPDGLYFSKEEVDELNRFRTSIDEDITSGETAFVDAVRVLFAAKVSATEKWLSTARQRELNLTVVDSIGFSEEKPFVAAADLSDRWHRWLKLQVLWTLCSLDDQDDTLVATLPPSEKEVLDEVVTREECRLRSIVSYNGGLENYVGDVYLKSIAFAIDPHTDYFSKEEANEFYGQLSKETLSYGIELDRNRLGEIIVAQIVPGSPAWNSNLMNEGDVILKVSSPKGVSKHFTCLSMSEAVQFVNSKELDEASFHIRKQNGLESNVTIFKDTLNVEDNTIQSFLLNGEKKLGYIYLPSFYAQMDGVARSPLGCANDVAKELIKLNAAGIDALVLDLRNNGGGSLQEAIRLAGIFIDNGALAVVKYRDEEAMTLKDMDRGAIFTRPMIVMINTFSASASELFAAAMQDHNRAVIVGTNSFGKSTIQDVIPVVESGDVTKSDYMKMTIGQFFRVTGQSLQKVGVKPDVLLPDLFEGVDVREAASRSALEPVTIEKKTYYWPLSPLPVSMLNESSKTRTTDASGFAQLRKKNASIRKAQLAYHIPLTLPSFRNYIDVLDMEEEDGPVTDVFAVVDSEQPDQLMHTSAHSERITTEAKEFIQSDPEILEVYRITIDLLKTKN